MLPASELDARVAHAGFRDLEPATWDKRREFEEWMDIVNDPARAEPIRTVVRALAEAGRTAGIGLSIATAGSSSSTAGGCCGRESRRIDGGACRPRPAPELFGGAYSARPSMVAPRCRFGSIATVLPSPKRAR